MAPLPDLSKQKGNLKLHLCNEQFEAYSASYLTTRQHMLAGMMRCVAHSFLYACSFVYVRLCLCVCDNIHQSFHMMRVVACVLECTWVD